MLSSALKITLCKLAHAIATHLGSSCEVVVHDLTDENAANHSIIHIENGHITGRKVGDGASNVVLEQLSEYSKSGEKDDHIGYFAKTDDGKLIKSTTVYIKDDNKKVISIFSINQDITTLSLASGIITELVSPIDSTSDKAERIIPDVNELLDELIWQSVDLVGKPVSMMNKDDKIKAIRYLNEKGALLITKSGDKISNFFGISKFSLYSYIDTKQEEKNND
ncbi:MAG: transcriptional regulator [Ruminococcus sp.]|nr:transcriptional regulator [Ruminococcus sp.]MBQ7133855.1 transcriptional regulator [Ruminococcus sp.]